MDPHPLDDYVEATFAGRTWRLSLGLRAEVEFERRRGKEIGDVIAKMFATEQGDMTLKSVVKGFSAEDFCTLVWCMTLRGQKEDTNPKLTLEQFIDLVSIKDLRKMFVDVIQAAKAFRGDPHPDDPPPDPQEKNGDPLDVKPDGPASGRFAASHSGSLETR